MFREEKRLVSMLLCIALLLTMLPVAVFAQETPVTFRVSPSATDADLGDTIDFTVSVSNVYSPAMEFILVIPEGLRFVPGSGVAMSKDTLTDWTGGMDWTEETMIWTAYNDRAGAFQEGTVLLSFSCVAEAAGTYEVGLTEIVVFDEDYNEPETTFISDAITVADPTIPERPSSKDEPDRPSSKDEPDRPSSKDEPDRPSSKDEADTCQHSYSSNITVTPTCTNAGLVTYTCSHCGDSYTEELTAYGHEMKQGACIRCGYATEVPLGSYFRGTVIASRTEAQVGDVIDFTVYGYGDSMAELNFGLSIPQGLGYIPGSAVCPDSLKELPGWASAKWDEASMQWACDSDRYADLSWNTVLLTFSCTVEMPGTYDIGLADVFASTNPFDGYSFSIITVDETVTVTGTPESGSDYTRIYCKTAASWTACKVHWWGSDDAPNTTWPGADMTKDRNGIWTIEVPADAAGLVLNNGKGTQSKDQKVPTDSNNMYDFAAATWTAYSVTEPPTTAPADGEVLVRIKASDNKVAVGDTIDFTVSISAVTSPAMEFCLAIPQGLSFISGSGVCLSKSALGENEAGKGWIGGMDWTEDNMMWTAYNDFAMTFPEDCVLLTFSCMAVAKGTYEIGLEDIFVYSGDYDEYKAAVVSDAVNVTGECTHDYIGRITTQATCVTAGERTYICSFCGDSYTEEIPATGHSLTYVDATVTCTKAGNIAHYTCHCGKLFADVTALVELTKADLDAAALGHVDDDYDNVCDRCGLLPEDPTEPEPPTTAPADGEVLVRIKASDNKVAVGDTIDFTLSISTVTSPAMEFQLCIPEGLTFVPGSGDALDKAALGKNDYGWGWTGDMDWTEATMYFIAYNDTPMVFPEGSVLLSFSCYVDLPGTYEIGLVDAYLYEGYDYNEPEVTVVSDAVTATGSSACTHSNLTHVDATVTCTEAGNKAHYICACGKMFEDVTGLIEITEADLAIEALGHSFVDGVCERCDMPEVMPEPPFFRAAVKASKTEAQIGDVIDYVVYGYGDLITSLEFNLVIPAGMSYVKGSGVCPNDLADYLDWVAAEWTESSMMWTGYNDFPAFFEWNTVLLTFSCVVEKPGIYNIDLADFYACDEDFEEVFPMVLVDTVTVSCPDDSHSWLPATCLAPETCEYCGVTRGEIGTQHQYAPTVVAPSCEADGYTLHVCAVCQDSYTDTPTPSTGHDHQLDRVIPPGCTEEGYTIYTCHCGDSYETDKTQPLGHNENLSVLMPTCTAEGSNIYTCSRCGNRRYEAIPATGHSYRTSRVGPTCTEDGCYRNDCSQCGNYQIISTIPATGHSYQAQMTAPTCTEAGYTTHTCHCGYYYIDSYTQPLGHEEQCVTLAATCTTAGSNTYTCIRCGNERFQVLPATGHSYVTSWVEPTCTEIGGDRNDCTKCDSSFFISIAPATGHRYKAVVTPPTATEGGYTTHTCHCGDSYVDSYTEPLGMTLCGNFETFLEGTVTLELVKDGKTEYTVSVSGTTGSYELTGVLPGSYTLRVSKDLHVTREYEVTVEVNCAPVDVKLHRPGDINGDGRITVADVSKTYAHSKKAALLTGYEFLVADINGDSRITVADASKLYAHNKKVTILW